MTTLDTIGPPTVRTAVPASSRPRPLMTRCSRLRDRVTRTASWRRELLLVAVLYVAYSASRLPSFVPAGAAEANGRRVLQLEQALHLDVERPLDDLLHGAPQFVPIAAAYFYESVHYLVTAGMLVWLYRRRPQLYKRARAWLVAMTFPALIVFWLFPVTPPRSLPGSGVRDVVAEQHERGWWSSAGGTSPSGLAGLVNHDAAMPSLHVAWALWVGWYLLRAASHRWVRALGLAYPALTALVVLSTGNHYLLDVVAGVGAVALGRVLMKTMRRPSRRTLMWTATAAVLVVEVAIVVPAVADTVPELGGVSGPWLAAALGCQLVSIAHFVGLQRVFLVAAGVRVRWRAAASAVLAGTALSLTVPGGSVLSVAYVSKRMRR